MRISIIIVIGALISVIGCDKPQGQDAAPPPSTNANAGSSLTNPLDLQPTHPRPEFTLAIEKSASEPPQSSVVWTARVNTGGWKMTTESVLVEDMMGKMTARVYVMVHEPQPGDIVTQAQETLTGRHDAGTTEIQQAELSAKHTVRDSKPTNPQLYSVEKLVSP
jgi:hypothetical protein